MLVRLGVISLLAGLVCALGCASTSEHGSHTTSSMAPMAEEVAYESDIALEAAPRQGRSERQSALDRHAVGEADSPAGSGSRPDDQAAPPEVEETPDRGQLLIYSGALVLAIYEVEQTQDRAVELVEELGGYVSTRTSRTLIARVPAPKFREALTGLGELGDVLDRSWQAQDVTDEVRDLDIRLRNSLQLRNRLEVLLEEAETIEEALAIESELERVTLEIERIRGQLKSFEDRIAYSTIQIEFRTKRVNDVPDDDFLLPFRWLDTVGLQSLLRAPGVYR